MLFQLGNGVERALLDQSVHHRVRIRGDVLPQRSQRFRRQGRTMTPRSASCSAPSLHSVLPRTNWLIWSFIITP
jgi:hypothetical protein